MTNNELYRKIDAIVEKHKDNKPIVAILQDARRNTDIFREKPLTILQRSLM